MTKIIVPALAAIVAAMFTALPAATPPVPEPVAAMVAELAAVAELQAQLPELPQYRWRQVPAPYVGEVLAPGLSLVKAGDKPALHLRAFTLPPPEPELELLVTLAGGNNHEAIFRLELSDATLAAASCQLIQALPAGRPTLEASAVPAIGTPMQIEAMYQPDPEGDPGLWHRIDASCLLRDAKTARQIPPLPFVYTGSQMVTVERVIDGKPDTVTYFALASGRRGWANIYDDPDTLLASPLPQAGDDLATIPEPDVQLQNGTEVIVLLSPAHLPLTVAVDAAGALEAMSEEALVAAIAKTFATADVTTLRAIAVEVPKEIDDAGLHAARRLLLRAAVEAKVWAVPVFTWKETNN